MLAGGTSYAAIELAPRSVGNNELRNGAVATKKLRNGAVTSAKVKDGSLLARDVKAGQLLSGATGPQGPAGPKGDRGEPGQAATRLWAVWRYGRLDVASGATSVTEPYGAGVGTYAVFFDREVRRCAFAVIPEDAGFASVFPDGGNHRRANVHTYAANGAETAQAFHLVVFC